MKKLLLAVAVLVSAQASAACRWQWVDHDYDASTPAVNRQICDSSTDVNSVRTPSARPIQQPTVRPIETPSVPPVGASQCRKQNVFEGGRWVNKRVCN